jgi:hypothetical protein
MVPKHIEIAGRPYPVMFTSNALFRLEKETGVATAVLGTLLLHQRAGLRELQQILWAGLEGARLKYGTRPMPFSVDEVGDLIDEAGGALVVWDMDGAIVKAVMDAFQDAFPKAKRPEDGSTVIPEKAGKKSGKRKAAATKA